VIDFGVGNNLSPKIAGPNSKEFYINEIWKREQEALSPKDIVARIKEEREKNGETKRKELE
jgi:hypothetical protein